MTFKMIAKLCFFAFVASLLHPARAGESWIQLHSTPGDYIGGGTSSFFEAVTVSGNVGNVLTFGGGGFQYRFQAKQGRDLTEGSFYDAVRYPFNAVSQNGLSVSGNGRGCNTLTGEFHILEDTYDDMTGDPLHIAIDFKQHCEGGSAALFGRIRYNSETNPASVYTFPQDGSQFPSSVPTMKPSAFEIVGFCSSNNGNDIFASNCKLQPKDEFSSGVSLCFRGSTICAHPMDTIYTKDNEAVSCGPCAIEKAPSSAPTVSPVESTIDDFVTVCGDDPTWKASSNSGEVLLTCGKIAAVGATHELCNQLGDSRMAFEGCPVTCGNDSTWTLAIQEKKKTCSWVEKRQKRCRRVGDDGRTGKEACAFGCGVFYDASCD